MAERTEKTTKSELGEFAEWLIKYAAAPIDPVLIREATNMDLKVKTSISLGHGAALTAVTGKVQEILRRRNVG